MYNTFNQTHMTLIYKIIKKTCIALLFVLWFVSFLFLFVTDAIHVCTTRVSFVNHLYAYIVVYNNKREIKYKHRTIIHIENLDYVPIWIKYISKDKSSIEIDIS